MQLCLMREPWLSLNGLLKVDPASCSCTDCPGPTQHVVACHTLQQGDVNCLNAAAWSKSKMVAPGKLLSGTAHHTEIQ